MQLWKRLGDELDTLGQNWRWLGKMSSVPESTLSRWRDQKKYPSVEKVVAMAQMVGRSVEYLVTGSEQKYSEFSEMTLNIAIAAEKLSDEGKSVALTQVEGLLVHFPLDASTSSKIAM